MPAIMRTITGLTVAYIVLVAALMLNVSETDSRIGGVIFGEVVFSSPMLAGWSAAKLMKRPQSRYIMSVFAVVYPLASALAYYYILVGEHDAQWQLSFVLIPMTGFLAVLIFGTVAAAWRRPENPVR